MLIFALLSSVACVNRDRQTGSGHSEAHAATGLTLSEILVAEPLRRAGYRMWPREQVIQLGVSGDGRLIIWNPSLSARVEILVVESPEDVDKLRDRWSEESAAHLFPGFGRVDVGEFSSYEIFSGFTPGELAVHKCVGVVRNAILSLYVREPLTAGTSGTEAADRFEQTAAAMLRKLESNYESALLPFESADSGYEWSLSRGPRRRAD